jgi:hypothetical protein
VPDRRSHRGPHPEDVRLFDETVYSLLRQANKDLSWLLSRGYSDTSALKLVGDRFQLARRQRIAVMRCACSDEAVRRRERTEASMDEVSGEPLAIDGLNILVTVESALSGGVLIKGRDGCIRDMASVHGTFRTVKETGLAVDLIGDEIEGLGVSDCVWYLDRPVSNTGRLKRLLLHAAERRAWDWKVELVASADKFLID